MLQEKVNKDYIQAMKDKDQIRASTLSFLRAQVKNVMIEQKADALKDADIIAIIKKQVKQRQDSIEQFDKGGRADCRLACLARIGILADFEHHGR